MSERAGTNLDAAPAARLGAEGTYVRLAYADPPYPGMAGLYSENAEVEHKSLIAQLVEYDGWALSTDEVSLRFVLPLCPPKTRVVAWCRNNAPFFMPNPAASWEPVLLSAARIKPVTVRSYMVCGIPNGKRQRGALTGQKPAAFCEWVIRCLGAEPGDTLEDLFPGTGAMGHAWEVFQRQPPLFQPSTRARSHNSAANQLRRTMEPLDGLDPPAVYTERHRKVDRGKGART